MMGSSIYRHNKNGALYDRLHVNQPARHIGRHTFSFLLRTFLSCIFAFHSSDIFVARIWIHFYICCHCSLVENSEAIFGGFTLDTQWKVQGKKHDRIWQPNPVIAHSFQYSLDAFYHNIESIPRSKHRKWEKNTVKCMLVLRMS